MNKVINTLFLDECLSLVIDNRGKTPKKLKSDWVNIGYRTLSANNVKFSGLEEEGTIRCIDESTYRRWMKDEIERGDILLTSEAPAGQVMYWNSVEKVAVGQRLFCLRTNEKLDSKYLKYYLQSPTGQFEIIKNTTGSTVFGISAKMFEQIVVKVPEKDIQENIGSFLFSLDSKIEINNRINAELEAMVKTLYDYWFVQFDFPDENGKPYKSSGGRMVWDEILKQEIPEDWNVKKLGKVLDIALGGTPPTENKSFWENGTFNWLNSGEIADFPVVSSEAKITKEAINSSATEFLPKGTTLLSITRHLRPTILAIDACANQSVVGIKEKGNIKHTYIYPYLKNEIPRYLTLRTGAQQPHINKGIVEDSYIVLPQEDSNVLNDYNTLTEPIYNQIINNAFQNQQLRDLRDWLLPMLMNGQVKVN